MNSTSPNTAPKTTLARILQDSILVAALTLSITQPLSAEDATTRGSTLTQSLNADLALTKPDQFNWTLFVSICVKAPDELQPKVSVNAKETQSNNALWETWADDGFTFPQNPQPSNPPKWADRNKSKILRPVGGLELLLSRRRLSNAGALVVPTPADTTPEEVRRNEPAFHYIIDNNLFFREGLAKAFAQGLNANGYLAVG